MDRENGIGCYFWVIWSLGMIPLGLMLVYHWVLLIPFFVGFVLLGVHFDYMTRQMLRKGLE